MLFSDSVKKFLFFFFSFFFYIFTSKESSEDYRTAHSRNVTLKKINESTSNKNNKIQNTITLLHHVSPSLSRTTSIWWRVSFETIGTEPRRRSSVSCYRISSSEMSNVPIKRHSVWAGQYFITNIQREAQSEVKAMLNWPDFNLNLLKK